MENCEDLRPRSSYSLTHQCAAVFSGTLLVVSIGMHYGWPSPFLPVLVSQNSIMPISPSEGSWIIVMPLFGLPVGCVLASILVNRLGRKTVLLICSPITCLTWLVIAYAPSVLFLECTRFFAGIMDGMIFVTLPMYIGELADKKIRAFLCCCIEVFLKIGMLCINVIGVNVDIKNAALIASLVPAIHFVTFFWMPESPHFVEMRKIRKKSDVLIDNSNICVEYRKTEKENPEKQSNLLKIFKSKAEIKILLIMLGLTTVHHCSGYYPIAFYCLTIFREAGGAINATTATVIYLTVQVMVASCSGIIMDRFGRKPLFIISATGTSCALAIEGTYFFIKNNSIMDLTMLGFVPLAALLLHTISFCIGLASATLIMNAELFPIHIKAVGVSISNAMFGLIGATVSKFFQITKDSYGMHTPFFVFSICSACGIIFIYFCVPETKGKTLEQIQQELAMGDSKDYEMKTVSNNDYYLPEKTEKS